MTTAPVLALLKFTKNFIVELDVSEVGIRGGGGRWVVLLMQEEQPIASFSQSLQGKDLFLSIYL